jgi:hypothetical protein
MYVIIGRVHVIVGRVHAITGRVSATVGRRGKIAEEYHICLTPYRVELGTSDIFHIWNWICPMD